MKRNVPGSRASETEGGGRGRSSKKRAGVTVGKGEQGFVQLRVHKVGSILLVNWPHAQNAVGGRRETQKGRKKNGG